MSDAVYSVVSYHIINTFENDTALKDDIVVGINKENNKIFVRLFSRKVGSGISRNVRELCGFLQYKVSSLDINDNVDISPFESPVSIAADKTKVYQYFKDYYDSCGIYIKADGPRVYISDSKGQVSTS